MYSKNILFLLFAHAFLVSIFINNIFEYVFSFLVLIILGVLFFVLSFYKQQLFYYLGIIILGGIIGIYISQVHIFNIDNKNEYFKNIHKENNTYSFEIKEVHKKDEYENEYIGKIVSQNDINIKYNVSVIINISNTYTLNIGEIIETYGKIYIFQNQGVFQYKEFMNSKNIFGKIYMYNYETIGNIQQSTIKLYAQSIRKEFLKIIYKIYPKNEAIFLGGILLGARESLSDEIKEDFNNSGLTHFIAVSGFNITILILFIGYLIKYFPKILQVIIIGFSIIFFVLIVGDTAPVMRAAIMGLLGYVILISGRQGHGYSLLIFTAMIMIGISPDSLNYDISFHLSFLAVLGILYTQDFYKKLFKKAPEFLAVKEALVLTFAALTFTLPLMLFNFGQVSILSPFANISVTWTIPIAMLFGFISIIVYFVSPVLGEIVGYFTWILLKFDMLVVDFFGNLEFSVFKYDFGIYKNEFLILYFLLSVFILLYTNKKD